MILAGAAVPLLASMLLAVAAGSIRRRLPPSTAVRLLAAASLVIAVATAFVLAVVTFTAAGTEDQIAKHGHWSSRVVAHLDKIPTPVGIVAGVLLSLLALATARRLVLTCRALWAAGVQCRHLGDGVDGLVVVDDDHADAYALPGVRGRIIVSRGMLAALTPAERRVLLAHERAHLDHRHTLYVQLSEVAATANPLLRPVAKAVREGVERWADEDAAAAVGDRRLAARALARAALAVAPHLQRRRATTAALAATSTNVADRARALLAPPPRPRRLIAAAVVICAVVAGAGAFVDEHSAERTFDRAGVTDASR
jgi:beta-lactamase regulating signal transducer with metallopeptidase domain